MTAAATSFGRLPRAKRPTEQIPDPRLNGPHNLQPMARGRPRIGEAIRVRFPDEVIERVDELRGDRSRSEVIRDAVAAMVGEQPSATSDAVLSTLKQRARDRSAATGESVRESAAVIAADLVPATAFADHHCRRQRTGAGGVWHCSCGNLSNDNGRTWR